jgi:glucans biosynthesis protein
MDSKGKLSFLSSTGNDVANHSISQRPPRCGAMTRKKTSCLSPAVHGKRRCRMHGGAKGSGAPKNNQNALKHGEYTREAKAYKKEVSSVIKNFRKFIRDCDFDCDSDE